MTSSLALSKVYEQSCSLLFVYKERSIRASTEPQAGPDPAFK